MEEPRARGLSLWLVPEGEPGTRLAGLIDRLAARLETPPFPPHLTLLPGIEGLPEREVLAAARALASALRPLSVRLSGVEGRDEPFRCLFARAEADERLRAAHAAAALAFGREPDPAFLPHVSLVYGALEGAFKESLSAELAGGIPQSFAATSLLAWRTVGPVRDWREAGSFRLG